MSRHHYATTSRFTGKKWRNQVHQIRTSKMTQTVSKSRKGTFFCSFPFSTFASILAVVNCGTNQWDT